MKIKILITCGVYNSSKILNIFIVLNVFIHKTEEKTHTHKKHYFVPSAFLFIMK